METKTCNSATWILVLLAILLLGFQGRLGLLAVVLPISLLCACAMAGRRTTRLADTKPEKQ